MKTEITVVRDENGDLAGFEASEHSGDQPVGQNLTCASVTIVFEFLSELAEELPSEAVRFRQAPEETYWWITFDRDTLSERESFLVDRIAEGALSLFEKIQARDPDSCQIVDPSG